MTDPALPHRSSEDDPPDDGPSISELQRAVATGYGWPNPNAIAVNHAAPALLEIVAAAQAFRERWQTADFEDDTKPARQALFAALAKVRP